MAIKDKHWEVWAIRNDEVVEYDIFNHCKFVEDLKKIKELGHDKLNVTIGSALDIFGGQMEYQKVIDFCK